jgi:hypothetical protein
VGRTRQDQDYGLFSAVATRGSFQAAINLAAITGGPADINAVAPRYGLCGYTFVLQAPDRDAPFVSLWSFWTGQ